MTDKAAFAAHMSRTQQGRDLLDFCLQRVPAFVAEHSQGADVWAMTAEQVRDVHLRIAHDTAMRQQNDQSGCSYMAGLKAIESFARGEAERANRPKPKPRRAPREAPLTEGALRHVEAERAYREPKVRRACLGRWGAQCQCCGLLMDDHYGPAGRGVIEVHHLRPISTRGGEHTVDPTTELAPLCPNCHTMIHRGPHGPMTLGELREIYTGPTCTIANRMPD